MNITDKTISNFWKKVEISKDNFYNDTPCWEWTGGTKMGAGAFRIDGKTYYAYRISWILKNKKIPRGLCVLHKCDNRLCVNPDHLFLGTQKDNLLDMIRKGRRGIINNPRKLTPEEVEKIRELYLTGEYSQPEIANLFEISTSHVCNIINRKTWKDE